jgi:EpsI family protein
MKHWAFVVAVVMLLSTWGSLQMLSHGEPVLAKKPFVEFPLTISTHWRGKELGLQQDVLDVLKLTDYMMRVYVPIVTEPTGARHRPALPAYLYVGFYQSQRTGSGYHSPKNCLPGAGWQFVESEPVTVTTPGGKEVTINKVLIEKGLDKQVIYYWYQDRGRVVASEYWAKAYLIWDAMTKNRTDGALVRISVPVAGDAEEAYRHGFTFFQDLWPLLDDYLPNDRIPA